MFNGGSRKRAMSATLNSVTKQQQQQKQKIQQQQQQIQQQQLARNLANNSLLTTITNTSNPSTNSQSNNRNNRKDRSIATSKNKNKNLTVQDDEDEELIVDDDYKPNEFKPSLQNSTNLFNSTLFPSPNNLEEELSNLKNTPTSNALPLNLLSSVSNCHSNKLLNQHPLPFNPFQAGPFNSSLNNNLTTNSNPINDLTLQLNGSNNLTQRASNSNHNNSTLLTNNINININNRTLNNGQLEVVQAMLPMLGQEFIWPTHHPLNSLSQLSNLNNLTNLAPNQPHCSPSLPSAHLNNLLPNSNQASNLNNSNFTANKSPFPISFNSSPSLLFPQNTSLVNQFNNSNQQNKNSSSLPETWLNKNIENCNLNNQSSAFKKVNTINKLLEDNHFSLKRSYNDFSVENLSKSRKTRLSSQVNEHVKRLKEEENIDIEGEQEETNSVKKQDSNEDKNENKDLMNIKTEELKFFKEKANDGRKKANSTDSNGELDRSIDEDCSNSPSSQQVNINNLMATDSQSNCQNNNCQLPGCNCKEFKNDLKNNLDNKLIDLSNTLIKNNANIQEITSKLSNGKELDLVNNLMKFNRLNEAMKTNKNCASDSLFKDEIEKRIQLVSFDL